jgi:electron transport complex protein RnfG
MKQMVKLGLTLAAYAVAACFLLALVNNFTAPVILQHQKDKANEGMKIVYAAADDFEEVTDYEKPAGQYTVDALYLAKKDGKTIGVVAKASGPTYDRATLLVGFDLNHTVTGVQFLELTDSPGFGQKAKDPSFTVASGKTFYGQFAGKNADDGFISGKTFDAITGATFTSKGVGSILEQASKTAFGYLAAQNGTTEAN